jgi:thioesterase domain-containing protein
VTANQLIENARQLVTEGRYANAVVLVDPPRRQDSGTLRAESAADGAYTKPLPVKAGLK